MRFVLCHPGADTSTSDVYTGLIGGLRRRGHEVYEYALHRRIGMASEFLRYVWKKGPKVVPPPTADDVFYQAGEPLIARSLRAQPDVVLVVSGMYLYPDVFVLLTRAGLKTGVIYTESPYDDEQQDKIGPGVHIQWTNERVSAAKWKIKYLPHACDASVHQIDVIPSRSMPAFDVLLVGTGFPERIELLAGVDWKALGCRLGIFGNWELVGSRSKLRPYICPVILNNATETALLYRKAAIGLNLYRTSKGFGKDAEKIEHAESLNPRAYELAATGCFTLSDYRDEVPEIFGDLVPTFRSAEELEGLIRRWLPDLEGRRRIQAQLQQAVAAHTWDVRAAQIERDILEAGLVTPRPAGEPDRRPGAWLDREPHRQRALGKTIGGSESDGKDREDVATATASGAL